jgi:hypothetical protein
MCIYMLPLSKIKFQNVKILGKQICMYISKFYVRTQCATENRRFFVPCVKRYKKCSKCLILASNLHMLLAETTL